MKRDLNVVNRVTNGLVPITIYKCNNQTWDERKINEVQWLLAGEINAAVDNGPCIALAPSAHCLMAGTGVSGRVYGRVEWAVTRDNFTAIPLVITSVSTFLP